MQRNLEFWHNLLLVALALVVGTGLSLGVTYLAIAACIAAPVASRILIRRKLQNHKLLPTSKPPLWLREGAPATERKESAYDIRRRRNKAKGSSGSGGGVRAVFMTRGGHFYQ